MKVTFPSGEFISPGFHMFQTERVEIEEVWWMGHLIEEKEIVIHEEHGLHVPDPGEEPDPLGDPENGWPLRGTFEFADRSFTVVRDDDVGFWGFDPMGRPHTKASKMDHWQAFNDAFIAEAAKLGWWDVGPDGTPQQLAIKVSIQDMVSQNKPLMAHLMVDLKFFSSVGQAKKNGWDKPLELGRHELGPKKKRAFVEIIP